MNVRREIRKAKYVVQQLTSVFGELGELTAAAGDQAKAVVLIQALTNYVRAGGTASSLSALTRMELAMRDEPAVVCFGPERPAGIELPREKCKHCGRPISAGWMPFHLDGDYGGKESCDPADSKLPYGYRAEPVGVECARPCLGATS